MGQKAVGKIGKSILIVKHGIGDEDERVLLRTRTAEYELLLSGRVTGNSSSSPSRLIGRRM